MAETKLYERTFNRNCIDWCDDKKYNIMLVQHRTVWFNNILRTRGYVFLRDIFETLGITVDRECLLAGWTYGRCKDEADFIEINIQETDGPDLILTFNANSNNIERFN